MKSYLAAAVWFLGAWVTYEMLAFALALPDELAPFVAFFVAVIVAKATPDHAKLPLSRGSQFPRRSPLGEA